VWSQRVAIGCVRVGMFKVQSAREDKGVVVVEGWGRRGNNSPSMGKVSPLLGV